MVSNAKIGLRKAIDVDPSLSGAYTALGVVFARTNRRTDAIVAWQRAVTLDPGDFSAMYNLIVGLVESGQWRRRYAMRPADQQAQSWAEWSATLARSKHIPAGRLGRPDEPSRAVVFLASPLASYTSGSHIDVSGGLSRHA